MKNHKGNVLRHYELLKSKRYRLTGPRKAIISILCGTNKHLNADDIYAAVLKDYPDAGLATVYRNLEIMVRNGLASKVEAGDNRSRYELNEEQRGHHHHLICNRCKTVFDYTGSLEEERIFLKRRQKEISENYGFKIEGHCVDFSGLCGNCLKKK